MMSANHTLYVVAAGGGLGAIHETFATPAEQRLADVLQAAQQEPQCPAPQIEKVDGRLVVGGVRVPVQSNKPSEA